jgi:serine/threonine protein kinase, bacterial
MLSGYVTTVAGSGNYGSSDGVGMAATFSYPSGIILDFSGNIIVSDTKIRKIASNGLSELSLDWFE